MSDRDLDAYRKAYRYSLSKSRQEAPSDDELAALVTGELGAEERERVVMAMLKSPEAIEKHRILEELHRQQVDNRPRRSWYRGLAAAAVVVLAVSIWTYVPFDSPDTQRSSESATSRPSGNVLLNDAPMMYEWTAEPEASRYRLSIFSNAGNRLWQSDWVTESRVVAPDNTALTLTPGGRYYWTIDIDGDAARNTLGPYWFRLD